MGFKIEDIVFWILILAAIAVILWLFKGSPTLENAIISIGLFIIGSELLLWRKIFEIDKDTAISFTKLKNDINSLSSSQKEIKNGLTTIRKLVKGAKI